MPIYVTPTALIAGNRRLPYARGRGGFSVQKREGDRCTPCGCFPLREVWYRPDRITRPRTALPCRKIHRRDGWCDDPDHPAYNRHIEFPFAGSAEHLWRADPLYDLLIVLGYNDAPPLPGRGSAIFLHVARTGFTPTEGCIALRRGDLLWLLSRCGPASEIAIRSRAGTLTGAVRDPDSALVGRALFPLRAAKRGATRAPFKPGRKIGKGRQIDPRYHRP